MGENATLKTRLLSPADSSRSESPRCGVPQTNAAAAGSGN